MMVEIVFGDSARGILKSAQRFGKGKFLGGCSAIIPNNGEVPTPEELQTLRREAEERSRAEWEAATPMGGDPRDVFGFPLMLSIGELSEPDFWCKREELIDELYGIYPQPHPRSSLREQWKKDLERVCERASPRGGCPYLVQQPA